MLRGEINERIGDPEIAISDYNNIIMLYPNKIDTMYARWRLLYLNALLSDTTFGSIYDSLYAIYIIRVMNDICYLDTMSGAPPPPPKKAALDEDDIEEQIKNFEDEEVAINIKNNYPNPFTSLTEIQYFVSKKEPIKLTLYDINGRAVAYLIDKYVNPGWNTLIVNGSGLIPGAYILKLECSGKVTMKSISKSN